MKPVIASFHLVVAAGFWLAGLFYLTYPAWQEFAGAGPGLGSGHPVPLAASFLFVPLGAALLLASPWLTRAVCELDLLLVRGFLGDSSDQVALAARVKSLEAARARVKSLEETRAQAVDDSAAPLRRIERDLHDGAQARLVALAMSLAWRRRSSGRPRRRDPAGRGALSRPRTRTPRRRSLTCAISLAASTRPCSTTVSTRRSATLVARSPVPVRAAARGLQDRPSPAIETIAYFCTAELLANVAKHSGARHVSVAVPAASALVLRVEDDGTGGAVVGGRGGSGLSGLADRVATVDGTLSLVSPAGGPTHDDSRSRPRRGQRPDAHRHRRGRRRAARRARAAPRDAGRAGRRGRRGRRGIGRCGRGARTGRRVVDIRLPPTHTDEGLQAAIALAANAPGQPVMVFSQYVETALRAAAARGGPRAGRGYLLKDRVADVSDFVEARGASPRAVPCSTRRWSPSFGASRHMAPLARSPPARRDVLALMAEGRTNAGIAVRAGVTEPAHREAHQRASSSSSTCRPPTTATAGCSRCWPTWGRDRGRSFPAEAACERAPSRREGRQETRRADEPAQSPPTPTGTMLVPMRSSWPGPQRHGAARAHLLSNARRPPAHAYLLLRRGRPRACRGIAVCCCHCLLK